ncbi:hypothetical protein CALVIDRAFT_339107 [Calocera viscosa TUFC12733]|uniref:Uncharacterized protein n=1 Tax=Calocera viscosa (strain TUFC12733) TaxID=1330018 RepID=A0A167HH40_CALVF|nr:hypothetical protein CALVIDRAFT_339107 [Calocera viscosa TUFC12733]
MTLPFGRACDGKQSRAAPAPVGYLRARAPDVICPSGYESQLVRSNPRWTLSPRPPVRRFLIFPSMTANQFICPRPCLAAPSPRKGPRAHYHPDQQNLAGDGQLFRGPCAGQCLPRSYVTKRGVSSIDLRIPAVIVPPWRTRTRDTRSVWERPRYIGRRTGTGQGSRHPLGQTRARFRRPPEPMNCPLGPRINSRSARREEPVPCQQRASPGPARPVLRPETCWYRLALVPAAHRSEAMTGARQGGTVEASGGEGVPHPGTDRLLPCTARAIGTTYCWKPCLFGGWGDNH